MSGNDKTAGVNDPEKIGGYAGDLRPADYNPRHMDRESLERLGKSMAEFGDLGAIVFNRLTGHVVGGHQRLKKMNPTWQIEKTPCERTPTGTVATGYIVTDTGERWPYREVDWELNREKAANIAANRHSGEFIRTELAAILESLEDAETDMDLTGFSPIEIRDILHGGEPAVKPGEDTIPPIEPGPARTKRGDVWILGRHRLVCGDATDPEDYRRLFAGEVDRAALVVTDPPYGVAYQAQSGKFDRIHGDDAAGDDLLRLVKGALVRAMEYSTGEAAFYIFHASVTREDFAAAIRAAGLLERQYLIWAKPAPVLGHADYQWAHEPIFYSSRAGVSPKFYGDRKQTTMWRFGYATITGTTIVIGPGLLLRDGVGGTVYVLPRPPKGKGRVRTVRVEESSVVFIESGRPGATTVWEVGREIRAEHPTQKPVALIAHAINNSSRHGEIVLDPFMGSGTAIIAAEKTGRRGFGCEISPEYCDTTLRRWELWTGKQAKKEETNA